MRLSRHLALASLLAGLTFAQNPPAESFEVATIKPSAPDQPGMGTRSTPNSLTLSNNDLRHAILFAYRLQDYQLTGGPKWVGNDGFDISGKADAAVAALPPAVRADRLRAMLRTLLAERFQLRPPP